MPTNRLGAERRAIRSGGGFTLIEVSLAIVIGLTMIAAAVLIYTQAKNSAGNSRAQEKVTALDAVVEQYIVYSSGTPPSIDDLRVLWQRSRPNDFSLSPWGGGANPLTDNGGPGTTCTPGATASGILDGDCLSPDNTEIGTTFIITNSSGAGSVPATPVNPPWGGMLVYYNFAATAQPSATYRIWDESRRSFVQMQSFGIASTDQAGTRWFFVTGGSTGTSSNGSIGLGGCVGSGC